MVNYAILWTAGPSAGKMNSTFLESTFQNDLSIKFFIVFDPIILIMRLYQELEKEKALYIKMSKALRPLNMQSN